MTGVLHKAREEKPRYTASQLNERVHDAIAFGMIVGCFVGLVCGVLIGLYS